MYSFTVSRARGKKLTNLKVHEIMNKVTFKRIPVLNHHLGRDVNVNSPALIQ